MGSSETGPGGPSSSPSGPAGAPVGGAAPETVWETLAPGVVRCRLPGWDHTVGAVAGAEATLVVDAGASLGEGRALRQRMVARLGRPVRHLVLTHPHFDHVLGAGAFAGAQTYGAVGLGALLTDGGREEIAADAVRHGAPADSADSAAMALLRPGHEISGELVINLGEQRVVVANLGPAHTGYDLVVLVPDIPSDAGGPVVFCGDLVEESGEPQAGPDAHPRWWPQALDRLVELGGEHARYVPGHGATVDAGFVREQREFLRRRATGPAPE